MSWLVPAARAMIAVAAGLSIHFVAALKPTSAGAHLFFATWLALPYVLMAAAMILRRREAALSARAHAVLAAVSVAGILHLADTIHWRPDAQGALAVLMTPLLQGVLAGLLLALSAWWPRGSR